MSKLYLLILLSVFYCLHAEGQPTFIQPIIEAWKEAGPLQTERYDSTLLDVLHKHDSAGVYLMTTFLQDYVEAHPDKRLQTRLILFKVNCDLFFANKNSSLAGKMSGLMQAMRYSQQMGDQQLSAEVYHLYGDMCVWDKQYEAALFYNLKSVEIKQGIGLQYFKNISQEYFGITRSLYLTRNYEECIRQGLKCEQAYNISKHINYDPRDYIFLYDLVGAAYFRLNKLDSANLYFSKLIYYLENNPYLKDTAWNHFWLSMTTGKRARIALARNDLATAVPILQQSVEGSLVYSEWGNAAVFMNELANASNRQKNYAQARAQWHKAIDWAKRAQDDEALMNAFLGMANTCRNTGQADSTYVYYEQYALLKSKRDQLFPESELKAAKVRLVYDDMRNTLERSQFALQRERAIRNTLLVIVALVGVIVWLLYKRKKAENRAQREADQKEIANARDQVEQFRKHVVEKNNFIAALEEKMHDQQEHLQSEIPQTLLQYALLTDKDWDRFRKEFSRAYPTFFPILQEKIGRSTAAEERIAALTFLQMDNYQIANTLGIAKNSVMRSKLRLKSRLNLSAEDSLEDYISSLV